MSERARLLLKLGKKKYEEENQESDSRRRTIWEPISFSEHEVAEQSKTCEQVENENEGNLPTLLTGATKEQDSVIHNVENESVSESFDEDSDDSIKDPNFSSSSNVSRDQSSDSSAESPIENDLQTKNLPANEEHSSQVRKGKKRRRDESKWQKNLSKTLRNNGLEYKSNTKKKTLVRARTIKPPCSEKCKLRCSTKIKEEDRQKIFNDYWGMANLQRQRDFISSCMSGITPRYRYVREGSHRRQNNAFHFDINEQRIRVCKVFFKNTLDINDRPIRTVIEKKTLFTKNIITEEKRGKHKKHKCVDDAIKEGVRDHIRSIPAIESHYTRAHTTRKFIDGSKSIADIHRDYVKNCEEKNLPHANYIMFNRIFNEDFNISFFTPKKDQCGLCVSYANAEGQDKEAIANKYEQHLVDKNLARDEKNADKEKVGNNVIVACYDLQAVLQCPKGEVSVFYYKSKLNVLNLTVYELKTNNVECFVWHEGEGGRGSNEIGSCLLEYLKRKSKDTEEELEFIFYSDNCGGQQKNRFMFNLYLYAVRSLKIKRITHKYLITGHTQNEGDSAHSIIERQVKRTLKSGPIYTADQYVAVIRSSKKTGVPYKVNELCFDNFVDLKDLAAQLGINFDKNTKNEDVGINKIKILKVDKQYPFSIFYKTSYLQEEYDEITIRNKRTPPVTDIVLKKAYSRKPKISEKKKAGLLELLAKNDIPKCYSAFYENL